MRVKMTTAAIVGAGWLVVMGVAASAHGQQALPRPRETSTASSRDAGVPGFVYRDSDGCGQLTVYTWSDDRMEVFRVEWDLRIALGIPAGAPMTWQGMKTFELKDAPKGVRVAVDMHPSAVYSIYCTAVKIGIERRVVWRAIAGTLTIDVGENTGPESLPSFPVVVTLKDAVFEAPDGRRISPVLPLVLKTTAGRPVGG